MQVVELRRFGGPEGFAPAERPRPEPGPRQVLVQVHAAGLNPIDAKIRSGRMRPLLWPRLPTVLGYDFCGQVLECGPEVTRFKAWDWVCGMSDQRWGGCYAEEVLVGVDCLAPRPMLLPVEQGAALPLAGLTALSALRELGKLQPGHRMMVLGAAGGVGHLAVQLGVILGARVTAVCSKRHEAFVKQLGARQVLDYQRDSLGANGAPYDLILDTALAAPFAGLRVLLADQGIYVGTGPRPDRLLGALRLRLGSAQRVRTVRVAPDGAALDELVTWVERGRLVPHVEQAWPLARLAEAHGRLAQGHLRGKLVLSVKQAEVVTETLLQ